MRQVTLATVGFERYSKPTQRAAFLDEMNRVVPWRELCALIEPVYPQAGKGRTPVGLERMLRIYFLQQWFNLSDPGAEEALYDSLAMRQFVGIDLGGEPVPDETTLCKLRHLLERHDLGGGDVPMRARASGTAWFEAVCRHDCRCQHHSRTKLDEDRCTSVGPGDAPDQEGQPVVLRIEGAYRRGQPEQGNPRGGGDGSQCGGRDGAARSTAW